MKNAWRSPLFLWAGAIVLLAPGCNSNRQETWDLDESTISLSPLPVVADSSPEIPTRVEFPMKFIGGLVVGMYLPIFKMGDAF